MRNLKKWIHAAILFCGTTMVLTSCSSQIDTPTPSSTLPKSYYLVANEYKEALLGELVYEGMAGEQDQGESLTIDGPKAGQGLTIYFYRPDNVGKDEKTPVIYYCCHGGGYMAGSATMYGNDFREMANRLGATVFSVEYTLPIDPSYTYHIELDEAYAGLAYIHEHADELHVDGDNIVIMGDSAGGGLATRMALWNKDKGNLPIKGEVLLYPMLDYRTGGPDDLYQDDMTGEFVWSRENNVYGWTFLKHNQEIPADEMIYYSPSVATPQQLTGMPSTFLIVGALDLFVHEDVAFVEQLKKAGIEATLFVEPGVPHAYNIILLNTPQTIRLKELRDKAVKQMFN